MAAFLLQHRAAFLSCAVGTIDVGLEAWDTGLFDAIDKANRVRPGDFLSRLSRAGVDGEVFLVNEPLRLVRVVGSTSRAVDMGMLYNFALAIRRSDNTKHLCLARPGENPCYISSRVVRIATDPNREEISIYHTNNSAIGLLPIVE